MVERTKTEVPTGLIELAERFDWAQSLLVGVADVDSAGTFAGVDGSAGMKRPG
jgi:hypothetical protein